EVRNNGYQRQGVIEHERFDRKGYFNTIKEVPERIGEHVNTFNVLNKSEELGSLFYEDGTRINDIVLLMRLFVGDYICLEYETLEVWNKYSGDQLEQKRLFNDVISKIEYILHTISPQHIKDSKLDKLIFLYIEMQKNAYLDTKIALLGPIINILIDLNTPSVTNDEDMKRIEMLNNLKIRVNQDTNYSSEEKDSISIGITKLSDSLRSGFTDKTIHFLKHHECLSSLHDIDNFDEKVLNYAQLINSLRNGVLHSGNLRASGIERRFRTAKLPSDDSTFTSKVRVFQIAQIIVIISILRLLGIEDYHTKTQDLSTVKEYFFVRTFRGL
ncbi:MAG: hypothetical protein K0Q73_7497, partial [Paenibacillus sp.]|nr:hypothetical protein [Paenibacillus sp.]